MQSADMTQEQSAETMEIVVMAIDKFSASANYEVGLPHTHTHTHTPQLPLSYDVFIWRVIINGWSPASVVAVLWDLLA